MNEARRRTSWAWWLVVIVLWVFIGIVLFPLLQGPCPSPRSSCANNLHQIGLAMNSYEYDWGDRLPVLRTERQQAPDGQGWLDGIRQYIRSESVITCTKSPKGYLTYAFNRRLSGILIGSTEIDGVNEVVMVYDSVNDRREINNLNGDTVWRYQDGGMPQPGQYVPWEGPVERYTQHWPEWARPRHMDSTNVLFVDGHVESADPSDSPRFDPKAQEETRP